ncbi:hypothetical protein GQ42DRAFT_153945 [Ramicandelaber brevisporus]|nr:hypothetical protein GQ42DRAFT_153945 [Ramicandelaber brevisporus]
MPPKRHRTTTATVSTTLDSLRDKIRGFVDTANEEQLREVSRLIDRLSISNSGPFRLGDLPFDLLEYTAQNFFTPKEAAPLTRINSTLGEFFANVVWKRIVMTGGKISGKDVSSHALIRNARRIRHVNLSNIPQDFLVSLHFPNVTSITFDLDKSSGHVKTIMLEVGSSSSNMQLASRNLAALLDQISNKSRIRVKCSTFSKLSDEVVPFLPSLITKLNLIQNVPDQCMGMINRQYFYSSEDTLCPSMLQQSDILRLQDIHT